MTSTGWDIWYAAYQVCFQECNKLNQIRQIGITTLLEIQ